MSAPASTLDPTRRRWIGTLLAAAAAGPWPARAQGDKFPARTVRIVVPYSVGIGPDLVARTVGEWLAAHWGQPVVVENRPGAAGIVAFAEVRKTSADGHTLFVADTGTLTVNALIYKSLPYDPARDLVPISLLFRATFQILVGARSPYANAAELLAAARRQPGRVTYASLGNGHPSQVAVETWAQAADVRFGHVPFKEAGGLFAATANGDVDFTAFSHNSTAGLQKAGRLRALAVAAPRRQKEAPEVPTLAEAGVPAVQMRPWAGLVAVAGTPAATLAVLQQAVAAALAAPEVRARIEAAGFEVTPSTPGQMSALVEADRALAASLVREGRLQAD